MIRKAARTNLKKPMAELAFAEAKEKKPGAVVEMFEQDDHRWTVTIVWDDNEVTVTQSDLLAFDELTGSAAPVVALRSMPTTAAVPRTVRAATAADPSDDELGVLSKRFESNGRPDAIGHDSTGGFSYGAYQIATRTGTMARFIAFLGTVDPAFQATLRAAGDADAARRGDATFQQAWRDLARDPAFLTAQHGFVKTTHYDPFLVHVRQARALEIAERSFALKNVAWSTAVQHGASNDVFESAMTKDEAGSLDDRAMIVAVYRERSRVDVRFARSSAAVKAAVRARFVEEGRMALRMLDASA